MLTGVPTYPSAVSTVSPAWTPIPTRIACSGSSADATWASSRMARPARTAGLTEGKTT